ncbi:hypothetical protein [Streptomyces sp. NPDC059970]|uniref:hypothetical protein n=1 Tax=Streptomyces sp. NPDC059970 TaxID=3347019 RepID=UPI00367CAC5B
MSGTHTEKARPMAQTKFDKQVEESAEFHAFGIGRFLAGRPLRGEWKTDATFWSLGTRVLPKVEGRVSRLFPPGSLGPTLDRATFSDCPGTELDRVFWPGLVAVTCDSRRPPVGEGHARLSAGDRCWSVRR